MIWKPALQGQPVIYHPLDALTARDTYQMARYRLNNTYRRIEAIDDMVDISPGTFIQYQVLKVNEL